MKFYKGRDWLYKKYIDEKLSSCKIALILGLTTTAVQYWLKSYQIPMRTLSQARRLRKTTLETRQKMSLAMRGYKHPQFGRLKELSVGWKGGRFKHNGYIYIYDGINSNTQRCQYKAEHRIVIERILGRPLKNTEHIHHINGNGADNRPSNLRVYSRSEHARFHMTKGSKRR